MTWGGRMNRTSNWSHCFPASMLLHLIAVKTHHVIRSQRSVLCHFPAACGLDWSSVLLRQHTDSLMRFCSSPEPDTNYGMLQHDHASLTGTARGYVIVSRTLKALLSATAWQYELRGEPAEYFSGLRRARVQGPFSPGKIFCSMVEPRLSILTWMVDPQ